MTESKNNKSPELDKAVADMSIEKDFPENLDQLKPGMPWFNIKTHRRYVVKSIDKSRINPICLVRADDHEGPEVYSTLRLLRENYLYSLNEPNAINSAEKFTAPKILEQAISTMADRGKTYDTSGQGAERSMDKIVNMFNALTGHNLTTAQGWKFMCCLKLARSEQGQHKDDNYLDGAAYFALAGEAASEDNSV